jgi:hypothetical protein
MITNGEVVAKGATAEPGPAPSLFFGTLYRLECKLKLGRDLTEVERTFITSRGGFLALEAIHL